MPFPACAHSFAAPYTLPVPFSLYAYGAAAALVLSFVVVGLFARAPVAARVTLLSGVGARREWRVPPAAVTALRGSSVALLLLCIATGLFGTKNPFANFNMTFFWIMFVLGFAYLSVLCGDIYRAINPWLVLCETIERLVPGAFRPRLRYPAAALGYYPALLLYMVFIWLELFGHTTPRSLSLALAAYTGINLLGAALTGKDAWFRYGEFFAAFLRLIAMMAPVRLIHPGPDEAKPGIRIQLRAPFTGLLETEAAHVSLAVFILFMLSSTAYDGMHESQPWSELFWRDIYPIIGPHFTAGSRQPFVIAAKLFHQWQSLALFLSPLLYLACYLVFLKITQLLTGTDEPVRRLALRFAHSLVPIAFVYHVTHYYTLLLSQGPAFFRQLSDPFGFGWNLFGTAGFAAQPVLIDANVIWHTQVGLILLGHVLSVYLAHREALKTFHSPSRAALSQLPMLLLMVGLTAAGLWILSLPIAAGGVAMPAGA
jgi:hypothetical protein